ncbi:MAG: MtrB/PioB family decaheme-associated outer membrane protein [Chromatiaceae bacterium]|nr:MtrB/PioB family decaheme-associated outer membrane protein [Chromatiaceae bacterium]
MKKMNDKFTMTTLAVALAAVNSSGAYAMEDDFDDEPSVEELSTPSSSVSFGIGHWSGEREQYGMFDGIRDDGTVLLLDADINQRDDATGTWITGKVNNLGQDNRDAEFGYERQGDWGVGINYDQTPRYAPYEVNTGLQGSGSDSQSLVTVVPGAGQDKTLNTERKEFGVNLYKYLTPELKFKADFRNLEKDGARHWGYRAEAAGNDVVFVTEPIDATTQQWEALLEYTGEKFQLNSGYSGSRYSNHESLASVSFGAATDYLSLPFDNQAHQFFVNGGYSFTPTTRGTFKLSYTHATADENIPTASAPGITLGTGAPTDFDGEVNTTLMQIGLTARPVNNLSVLANLRYHKVDEQTPEYLIDLNAPDQDVHSTPLDFRTISGKLEGTYRLPRDYAVTAGIDHRNQKRTVPAGTDNDADGQDDERYVPWREDIKETTYRLQLRKSVSETINGAIDLRHSQRDGSDYENAIHADGPINPFNISDRDRDTVKLALDWMPTNQLGMQFNYEQSWDDYSSDFSAAEVAAFNATLGAGSPVPATTMWYGLQDGSSKLISLDMDYVFNEEWRMYGWVSRDETRATEHVGDFGVSGGATTLAFERTSKLKDTGTSIGLGIKGKPSHRLSVKADLEWTRSKSEFDDNDPSVTDPLPDINSTATKLTLSAEYALTKNSDLRLDLIHQRWKSDDWRWEFADGSSFVYDDASDGTTVTKDSNQDATFVGLSYRYRF